jgi:hypothetical protein
MNISHLLRQLPAWWADADWPTRVFRKYFLTDANLLAYYFSTDVDPDKDPSEKHDRLDDLFVVTENFLTFYRLSTTGLRRTAELIEAEAQSLEKTVIPLAEITSVKTDWGSTGSFIGDAPPEDERRVGLVIRFRDDSGPLGAELTLPYRVSDLDRDRELAWHQTETFAEALMLALEERHDTAPTLNLTDTEE